MQRRPRARLIAWSADSSVPAFDPALVSAVERWGIDSQLCPGAVAAGLVTTSDS
jgi:hypothetical protein